MADPKIKDKPDEQADVQPAPAPERAPTRTEQEQRAISQVAQDAKDKRLDTTVEGGRYLVDGMLVDANGNPLKDKG